MDRVKLVFPEKVHHTCHVPILIQHINYGNHVGNDSVVSLLHHARILLLESLGCSELNIAGVGLIMADLQVQYKAQMYVNEHIEIKTSITDFTKFGFSIYYQIEKKVSNKNLITVLAKTNMLCFNYDLQKLMEVPEAFIATVNKK